MRQSQLFTKTKKSISSDEVSRNAELLVRAGFVYKEMSGVYSMLPLGLRVMNKISDIVRDELDMIGCQEVFMTTLQDPELWKITDRWTDKIDNWFTTELSNGSPLGLALTHEEALARILKDYVSSYRDLPKYIYQIQTKFRNELRAKSGMMRGREFLMKDLYSFNTSEEDREKFYNLMKEVYMKIFIRVGLGDITYLTFASGGIFSEFSHEFQTLSDAGEDTVYVHEGKNLAINDEVYNDKVLDILGFKPEELVKKKSIEVGNIFPLGTKYSTALGLNFTKEDGSVHPVVMGSYGIGIGRLMGTVVEALSDERGIVWPKEISPFAVHLISLCHTPTDVEQVEEIYKKLQTAGIDVFYDDRDDLRAGEKFADSDLIGISTRLVISPKTIKANVVEKKDRGGDSVTLISIDEFIANFGNK